MYVCIYACKYVYVCTYACIECVHQVKPSILGTTIFVMNNFPFQKNDMRYTVKKKKKKIEKQIN